MLCAAAIAIPVIAATACTPKHVDYASQLKLDFKSDSIKQEVTVRNHIDGDTTHFDPVKNSQLPGCDNASDFSSADAPTKGYAKARYIAINTPESTGQIEPYGKKASNFTKGKLETAKSIVIESDDNKWNIDSTGTRYVLWIWYIPEGETEYKNLNIEILQEGLAWGNGVSENRYGDIAQKAVDQAEREELNVYSGEKDPDFDYSLEAKEVTLAELRFNPESFVGMKVSVTGLITADYNSSTYIEKVFDYYEEEFYDPEEYEDPQAFRGEAVRIGMPILHFGVAADSTVLSEVLKIGNYVKAIAKLTYYDIGGYYQLTDLKEVNEYQPNNPNNCKVIEPRGTYTAWTKIDPVDFASTNAIYSTVVTKEGEDELVKLTYAQLNEGTSVTVEDVRVTSVYTTTSDTASDKGAMTLTCTLSNGSTIDIRTGVFYKEDKTLYTEDDLLNKRITIKGIVEYYSNANHGAGGYQIKCYKVEYFTILDEA